MIYFKSFIFRLLIVLIQGTVLFLSYWAIAGQVSQMGVIVIVITALVLSPRFEVIDKQSGQELQMKGFPVIFMNWLKSLSGKKK